MKLNNLTQKNVLNFTQIYYLLNAYVNMNMFTFNLIIEMDWFILIQMKLKITKCLI